MNVDMKKVNGALVSFAKVVNSSKSIRQVTAAEKLKVGVDLGTSSIVITILDKDNNPIYGAYEYANAVQDGIVVNYLESVSILQRLKEKAEGVLERELTTACGAIPPGTGEGSAKIVSNVIEAAGMECTKIVDEPTAAGQFLHINEGTVVDIGGGTTGLSIFNQGKLIKSIDEPTGGTHMTLVLAGYHHMPYEKAELMKRNKDKENEVFPVVRPVIEKMATIAMNAFDDKVVLPVYVVGGSTNFKEFEKAFSKVLKVDVVKPKYPQYVTPLGIAMYDNPGD